MKNKFPGYYLPTHEEFTELWDNCTFIFDANVLLNLYRYTPETRDEFISILEELSDRIWLPHQAALEYHHNRIGVVRSQVKSYDEIQELLEDHQNQIKNNLNYRHPYVKAKKIISKVNTLFEEITKELKQLQKSHPDWIKDDPVLKVITRLFDGKVGDAYPIKELDKIYKDGEKRYKYQVPPGYEDQKKDDNSKFNDLVLWFQVIDYAKENKKPIIFITDDRKEDWWLKHNGTTLGPRPELINEIVLEADVSFYMYSADPFMSRSKDYVIQEVSQQAIEEVQEVRKRDEKYYVNLQRVIESIKAQEEIATQLNAVAQSPIVSKELEALQRAVVQFPRFSDDELELQRRILLSATVPFEKYLPIRDKYILQMEAVDKFPVLSEKGIASLRDAYEAARPKIKIDKPETDEENGDSSEPEKDEPEEQ